MGYVDFSKSERAAEAEGRGLYPVSICARKTGVPATLIRQFVVPAEWHHTSSWFNATDYYDIETVLDTFGKGDPDEANPEAVEALANYTNTKFKEEQILKHCRVEWVEWSGSRQHPKATNRTAEDAVVIDKGGAFVTVILPDGRTFRKKKTTAGFYCQQRDE